VVITNTATDGGALTIDSFQVFGANTTTTTANSNSNSTSNSISNSASYPISSGVIAVAVIGGVVALLIILRILWFFWKRKRNHHETDEADRLSIAQPSYIERVRNINFTFPAFPGRKKTTASAGLSRSASRGSEETVVDPENGNLEHTQKKGKFGYGFGLGASPKKWLDSVKGMVVRNPDPPTPPLPVQNQQRERPVIDIRRTNGVSPGMVTVGLESGLLGGNTGYAGGRSQHNNPNAAQVWATGTQQIEAGGRFSDYSLEQAWENRVHYGAHHRNPSLLSVSRPHLSPFSRC
jgi:hypothetical protein